MTYAIEYTRDVDRALTIWKKSNPVLFKKYCRILEELMLHPKEGMGHPEPLVGGSGIRWSRRVSKNDRIIYDIYENTVTVLVIQVGGHYNDK